MLQTSPIPTIGQTACLTTHLPFNNVGRLNPTSFCHVPQAFIYLAGLQLLLTSGRKSLLVLGASGLAGLLYKFNFCHIRRLRVRSTVALC